MNKYIFLTSEGMTTQPPGNPDTFYENSPENLQVIGFEPGETAKEAFETLLKENKWIKESNFNEVFSYQLDSNYTKTSKWHYIKGE